MTKDSYDIADEMIAQVEENLGLSEKHTHPQIHGAIKNLREHQQQMDIDGCRVGVSRQALDETLDYIETMHNVHDDLVADLEKSNETLQSCIDEFTGDTVAKARAQVRLAYNKKTLAKLKVTA